MQSGVRDPRAHTSHPSLSLNDYVHLNLCLAHQKYSSVVVLTWGRIRLKGEVAQEKAEPAGSHSPMSEQLRLPCTPACIMVLGLSLPLPWLCLGHSPTSRVTMGNSSGSVLKVLTIPTERTFTPTAQQKPQNLSVFSGAIYQD